MLESWLNGDVPRAVMADWCEEHARPFPRFVPAPRRVVEAKTLSRSGNLSSEMAEEATCTWSGTNHGIWSVTGSFSRSGVHLHCRSGSAGGSNQATRPRARSVASSMDEAGD